MDLEYLIFLQNIREATGGVMDGFMLFMTSLAETKATFLLLAFIYWIVDKRAGRFMGMNVSLSCAFSQMLKTVFHVDRPWIRNADINPVEAAIPAAGGYSFPSGHTTRAAATWGALGIYLVKDFLEKSNASIGTGFDGAENGKGYFRQSLSRIIGIIMIALIVVIGFSRNYLGVHTPQDVIVAFLYSIVMWYVSFKLLNLIDNYANADVIILIVYAVITVLWLGVMGSISNAGAGQAYLLSLILDKRVIHYKLPKPILIKLVIMVIGGAGLLFLINNLANILLPICGGYTGMVVSFVYMFYIMTIVPWLCMVIKRFTEC